MPLATSHAHGPNLQVNYSGDLYVHENLTIYTKSDGCSRWGAEIVYMIINSNREQLECYESFSISDKLLYRGYNQTTPLLTNVTTG